MKIIFTIILIITLLAIIVLTHYIVEQNRRLNSHKLKARDRLKYIQILMRIVYYHKHDPIHLTAHIHDEMSILKILSYHIIDDVCDKYFPPELKCSKNDKLLYILHEDGFTARELCVIFGLNNMNSVYVKCSRINKKLNKEEGISLGEAPSMK